MTIYNPQKEYIYHIFTAGTQMASRRQQKVKKTLSATSTWSWCFSQNNERTMVASCWSRGPWQHWNTYKNGEGFLSQCCNTVFILLTHFTPLQVLLNCLLTPILRSIMKIIESQVMRILLLLRWSMAIIKSWLNDVYSLLLLEVFFNSGNVLHMSIVAPQLHSSVTVFSRHNGPLILLAQIKSTSSVI